MNFTLIKNGQSKTVGIDENPNEFICDVISYINELSAEKYQLDCGCKNKCCDQPIGESSRFRF